MKMYFGILTACLFVVNGFAQQKNEAEQQIIQLENKWMNAMMHKDSVTCSNLMHPDFIIQGINDLTSPAVSRTVWMENMMHHLNVDSISYSTIKVDVKENTAIARSRFYWKASFNGNKFTDNVYMVDLWLLKNNQWVVVDRMVADNH